ncbi:MAG: lamin tail domain-containing protein [Minicystis sp.]
MKQSLVTFVAVALFGGAGCELISNVDRGKIPDGNTGGNIGTGGATSSSTASGTGGVGTGGTGGATSSSTGTGGATSSSTGTGGMGTGGATSSSTGTGGSGTGGMGTGGMGTGGMGTGGTGGGPQCTSAAQCPTPPNECVTATCVNGTCGTSFVADQTPTSNQTKGDCHKDVCDGAGQIVNVVDDTDAPDDNKACTDDICTNGTASHPPKTSGTVCGTNLVCDANGNCVGCNQASDCPGQDTTCQTRTCTGGMCGFSFATAGTPAGTQTSGDCHKSQCDGSGAIVSVVDDTDTPNDNKECTTDACNNGVASSTPVTTGTACTQNNGSKCDATGNCVACLQASDCGVSTACKTFTCTAGQCGSNNAPPGTVTSNPIAGDCKSTQCDGNGNSTVNAADPNDKPNDNNQCTNDVCTGTTPSNPPATAGTTCSQNGGSKCDGNGACVQCLQASDCGVSTPCKTFTCNGGTCGSINAGAGVVAGNPTLGDCKTDQCDGMGGVLTNQIDNSDTPADDGNQCTKDVCVNGVPSHPPATQGFACNQNNGTFCNSSGACVQCILPSDCGTDTACKTFTCNAGLCGSNNAPAGTVIANSTAGDCRSDQCNGSGILVTNAVDNNDVPADDGNQCTSDTCNAGSPVHPFKPQGSACNQNGGNICNATGSCVTCSLDTDCPAGNACQVPKCNTGTCGFVAAAPQVLPAGLQTPGDCQSLTCDGTTQAPVSVADNSDVPADEGNQCTTEACNAGAPAHPAATAGTTCNQNGGTKCDGSGACVQCLQASDCPAPANECQVRACTNNVCGFTFVTAGTVTSAQTTGDCKQNQCDGAGNITAVAFDTDLPADDGNQCTGETCSNGTAAHPPVAAGTPCNQNGGTACNSAGSCVGGPGVASTTPADGGMASAATTIAVTFTQAMNPATLTGQTALGACTGSIQVSVNDFASCVAFSAAAPTMSGSNTVATFTVQPGLLVNRTYKIRVTTAAQNASSVPLGAQYTAATGFGTTNPLATGTSGVVISQVFGGGGGSNPVPTYKNDYVVLHNRGTTAVNLTGWSVQYGASGGTGAWTVGALVTTANPNPSIAAGGYFLVQLGGGTAGAALPPADSIPSTNISMSATAGKIALVNNTTALNGACPTSTAIVDVVGYGASNCSEGTAVATLNSTTAAFRNVSGCVDTNVNSADFTAGTPNPRSSASAPFDCTPAQNESGAALEADYCTTQFPLSLSVQTGTATGNIYGQIYETGVTEANGANASVLAQLGYGPTTANPEYEQGWLWASTTYNVQAGNNDEYQASFTAPAAGTYRYAYRFSLDNGASWTYCDNNQSDAGAGSNNGLAFDLENLAALTVTP